MCIDYYCYRFSVLQIIKQYDTRQYWAVDTLRLVKLVLQHNVLFSNYWLVRTFNIYLK